MTTPKPETGAAAGLDPRSVAAERAHQDWHTDHAETCTWDPADSLNDGCIIRYQRYRDAYGYAPGHSFKTKHDVQVIHPDNLPEAGAGDNATPVPPHAHLDDHDPAEWTASCCACQNQGATELWVDEDCPACRAQRDQDRAYVVREFAVRHPSGIVEERVPEALAHRNVKKHPSHVILVRERVITPDVVTDYVEVLAS